MPQNSFHTAWTQSGQLLVSRYPQEDLADLEKINPLWTY